jgi:hypothetical protein
VQGLGKIYKGTPAGLDVLNADTLRTARSSKTTTCLHCSPGYPDYRSILVKILPVKGRKEYDVAEILLLEVQGADRADDFDLPDDFWAFIKGAAPQDEESEVPKRRVLTPSEVNSLLLIFVFFCMLIHLECMSLEDMKRTPYPYHYLVSRELHSDGCCKVFILSLFTFFPHDNASVCQILLICGFFQFVLYPFI